MARINVKQKAPAIATHEGGPAKHINTTQQLRRLVLPCLLWEDSFYVDGKTIAEQIGDAVKASPASIAAAVAIEAREKFHLRHVPLLVVRDMARLHPGTSTVGDTLARVIQRPDEIGEFCAATASATSARASRFRPRSRRASPRRFASSTSISWRSTRRAVRCACATSCS